MFRPLTPEASERRRAVILIVVLVLLTLFAIVGLAFVLYANMEAESSRVWREAVSLQDNRIDLDPNTLASYSIGQLLFDLPDPIATLANPTPAGSNSAIRGHSLSRDIYGWNQDILGGSINAFNGVGRMHTTIGNSFGADDHSLLSYVPYPLDGFVRDPERLGTRANLGAALPPYTGGWNSSYTYPDGNHVFLGAFDADGNVIARSFVRPYLVPTSAVNGKPYLPLNPLDPNYWSWFTDVNPNNAAENVANLHLRSFSLRPRNKDMAAGFPPPQPGGDVRNLPINDLNPGVSAANDSVWTDLDFPVQLAPDGITQFKPLFAFFVADLEGRVNVNAHGNIRSTTGTHLSNQGWGKWEVNPAWLSTPLASTAPTSGEWPQMFIGVATAPTVPGRYGFDLQPSAAGSVSPPSALARDYGQADVDSSDDSGAGNIGGVATGPLVLPGDATAPAGLSFPVFPKGYSNGIAGERTNHPGIYDSQYPGGDDRRFNANHHLLEIYNGNASSPAALGTDFGKLLPNTMNPQNGLAFRVRNMSTTDSVALAVPGPSPWIYDRSKNGYGYGAAPLGTVLNGAPAGPAVAFPTPTAAQRTLPLPASTEFTVDWKSVDAAVGQVDLNRFLPPYPHLGQGTTAATYSSAPMINPYDRFDAAVANQANILAQFTAAQQARQQMADDIYRRLLRVTGVQPVAVPAAPTATDLAPRRWLAELAANIVDFIDEDEISTPFNYYNQKDGLAAANLGDTTPIPATSNAAATELPKYWVFGTELPKVVVNEVLAEYTPDKVNGNQFNVNVFAELFNPMPSAAQLGGAFPGTVQQQDSPANPIPFFIPASGGNPGYAPYQVVLADSTRDPTAVPIQNGLLPPQNINDNVLGTPNVTRAGTVDADFGNPAQVQTIDGKPAAATIAPQQYFLMTPGGADANGTFAVQKAMTPGTVPAGTPVVTSTNMTYKVKFNAAGVQMQLPTGANITDGPVDPAGKPLLKTTGITVVLRRLANPHMPPDPNPASPTYNPYVTSDYMTNVALQNTNNGEVSTAKAQPYAGSPATYLNQVAGAKGTTVDTFGQINSAAAFSWLVHLDRQLISPMELLHVSGYHPHELTYQFLPKAGWRFGHQADWYTETNRLYRAFEFLTTRDRAGGVSPLGGRQPGKININSIWNEEVLRAVADPQNANGFNSANVHTAFQNLIALRSPGYSAGLAISGKDRPFLGLGTGVMPSVAGDPVSVFDDGTAKPNNTGIEDTFLRSSGVNRLFDVTGANHPYRQTELMTKMFNNLTTRSNTFAVWVTVGFFRVPTVNGLPQHVDNLPTGPVMVAEEIGAATGTNIRHRLFAVVDRSRLTLASNTTPLTAITTAIPAGSLNQPLTVAVAAASGTTGLRYNAQPWAIQAGSILAIDLGTSSEETVVVQQVVGTSVTATFTKAHAANATVNVPGNPGPIPGSAPSFSISSANNDYPNIVLTYTVMQ